MITKKLNIGDYIFAATGELARITKVNKLTYTYETISNKYNGTWNIAFDGKKHGSWGEIEEWFECDDAQAKALELAFKKYEITRSVNTALKRNEDLIGKAKYFLNQITDIEEIEVEEEN